MYSKIETNFDITFSDYVKEQWKRFLDDCFIIWNRSKTDLQSFHTLLNSINPSIQFTIEQDERELPFLDILVKKTEGRIITDIYYKSTDTHQYLDFRSSHPSHTKRNIPFCLARRVCTIVADETLRDRRLDELQKYLELQRYPLNLIRAGINKAKEIPLVDLRRTVEKDNRCHKTPFVNTQNPCNPNMYKVIKAGLPILHRSERLKELFPENSFINSKRQPWNLKRLLTRARFNGDDTETFAVSPCNDSRCGMCHIIQTGSCITLKNGKIMKPNSNLNCKSKNLIYCITCSTCEESYIGQTGNSICERIRIHRQQLLDPSTRQISLSEHLETCGKGQYRVFPFYKMKNPDVSERLAKETRFIQIFRPKLNC